LDSPALHGQVVVPEGSSSRREEPRTEGEHEGHQLPETPITCAPRHLCQEMAAAAPQAQAQTPTRALAMPPQGSVTSKSGSGTIATSTNRAPHSADTSKPNKLAMPIQTPRRIQRLPPPLSETFPPRAVAKSPLARTPKAPGRRVSFAEPMAMQIRASCVDAADQAMHDTN